MSSDPSSASGGSAPATAAFALGPGLRATAFTPGRFATVIHRRLGGTHELQNVNEDATASFVLELTGGTARACRGWAYAMTNDGPEVRTEDRFREQAGFRGTYVERDGGVDVTLTRDDGVCPAIAEHTYPPERAAKIALRCVLAAPDRHPSLTAPVLVCRWTDWPTSERDAHTVDGLGPAGTFLLGAAPGLAIAIDGPPPGMAAPSPGSTRITIPTKPLADDAWRQPP